MKCIEYFTIVWLTIRIGHGYTGMLFAYVPSIRLLWQSLILVSFLFCSLLKKVTKEHLKDDFDALFKRLSSDNKLVTDPHYHIMMDFCLHTNKQVPGLLCSTDVVGTKRRHSRQNNFNCFVVFCYCVIYQSTDLRKHGIYLSSSMKRQNYIKKDLPQFRPQRTLTRRIPLLHSSRYNCWDTPAFSFPLNVVVKDLVTELRKTAL